MEYKIVQDSREQKKLWPEGKGTITKKLDTGDYSIEGYEDKITIERKSASDFWNTMTAGHTRFKKELLRAKSQEYFAVVVETNYTNILDKAFKGAEHTIASATIPLKIAFTIHIKYGVPFFFCNGRIESKKIIKEIFEAYLRLKL